MRVEKRMAKKIAATVAKNLLRLGKILQRARRNLPIVKIGN